MDLELARQHWQDGDRRVEAARSEPGRYRMLVQRVDVVSADLRRRLGQVFTLGELADLYDRADHWVTGLLEDADPEAAPVTEPGTIADAAFFSFARGASDYRP